MSLCNSEDIGKVIQQFLFGESQKNLAIQVLDKNIFESDLYRKHELLKLKVRIPIWNNKHIFEHIIAFFLDEFKRKAAFFG